MPLINQKITFTPPLFQWNGHLQTIIPSTSRVVFGEYKRERISTQDNDFLDLDWKTQGSSELIILTHGLEGSSERHYIKSPANLLFQNGYDILAWNCRSCSGEINLRPKLYHHGDFSDLEEVINHVFKKKSYTKYHLVGFSMGGNISLKYSALSNQLNKAKLASVVSVSAPMHLESCTKKLEKFPNTFYGQRFYKKLREKISLKLEQFPDILDKRHLMKFTTWAHFDEHISAPLNGYKNAKEFYYSSSSINFLPNIKTLPVLIISAKNDPILSQESHPVKIARKSQNIFLDFQDIGGHTGFMIRDKEFSYSDITMLNWLKNIFDKE